MPRYILVPESLPVSVNKEPWSFHRFIRHLVDNHPVFNNAGPGIRAGARILDALGETKVGSVCEIDEEDWQKLFGVVEAPGDCGYSPVMHQILEDGSKIPFVIPGRAYMLYLNALGEENTKNAPATAVKKKGRKQS